MDEDVVAEQTLRDIYYASRTNRYEVAPRTANVRLKKSFGSKNPLVLDKKKNGTYVYNEAPTNAKFVAEFKELVQDAIALNDSG